MLDELLELDGATNDRLLGEEGLLPGIGVHELVYGVDYAHIVNAAFTHAAPEGGRFNSNDRGAWYAGLERETSLAEVAFHKQRQLEEIAWPEDEIASLRRLPRRLHHARARSYRRAGRGSGNTSGPEPIPECYVEPQKLASDLLTHQSNGILYPSARRAGGRCLVCFRPALVYNVRRGKRLQFTVRCRPGLQQSRSPAELPSRRNSVLFALVFLEQLRKLLLQRGDLRSVAHVDIRIVGILQRVILVVVLRLVKPLQRNHLGHNRLGKHVAASSCAIYAVAIRFCSSLAKKIADRYDVPTSFPCRFNCVGSCATEKKIRSSCP